MFLLILDKILKGLCLLTFSSLVIGLENHELTFPLSGNILLELLLLLIFPYFSEDKRVHISSLVLSSFKLLAIASQILL